MTLINITRGIDVFVMSACAAAGWSPADATNYRFANQPGENPAVGDPVRAVVMTRAGTIKRVTGAWVVGGVLGSAQNMTVRARNTTAATTQDVTTTLGSGSTAQAFTNTSMTLAFAANEGLCIELVTPTWTTNPTVTFITASIEVEYT